MNPQQQIGGDAIDEMAPRVGFAWTMDRAHDTVVRGGVGVMYSPQMPAVVRQGAAHPIVPFRVSWNRTEALARGLQWPSYNDDLRLVVQREAAASGAPFFFSLLDPHLQNPYSVQTMINVQRGFGRTLMAEAGYVRVDGRKFIEQRLFSLAIDRETGARPNPALGAPGGYYIDNAQTSEYNALQTSLRKRFSNHYSFDVHYTLSKGRATQGGDVGAYYQGDFEDFTQAFFNPEADRGPTVADVRHRMTADVIYQLPQFQDHSLLRYVAGGWEVSGIFSARSGERLLITQPSGIPNSRPDFVGGNPVLPDWRATRLYLNRDSFALVPTSSVTRATLRDGETGSGPRPRIMGRRHDAREEQSIAERAAGAVQGGYIQRPQPGELQRPGNEYPLPVLRSDSQRRIASHDPARSPADVLKRAHVIHDLWIEETSEARRRGGWSDGGPPARRAAQDVSIVPGPGDAHRPPQ